MASVAAWLRPPGAPVEAVLVRPFSLAPRLSLHEGVRYSPRPSFRGSSMSSSIRKPRAPLSALLIAVGALHCAEQKCEDTGTCDTPFSPKSDADASFDASLDSSADSSTESGPTDGAAPDGDAEADVGSQADADADTGPSCNGGEACGCADLQTDPHHCGACGHECPTVACSRGVCEPLVVASGTVVPRYVTVDSTYVYWVSKGASASGDAIMRIPKSATVEAADAGTVDAGRTPDGAPPEAAAATLPSPQPTALATGLGTVLDVASVDDYVYWSEFTAQEHELDQCHRVPLRQTHRND